MYKPDLYSRVLSGEHRALRHSFPQEKVALYREASLPAEMRMALRLKLLLEEEQPTFLPGQDIVYLRTVTDIPGIYSEEEWSRISSGHFIHELGTLSNISADYASTIAVGLDARREELSLRLIKARAEEDKEGILFLEAAITTVDAVLALADKYLAAAKKQGLAEVAATLEQVPHKGARSFREALQFFRILHYTLWAEGEYHNTAGRFDLWAWPYLEHDLKTGLLTEEAARILLEDFFLSFNWDSDLYTGVQLGDNGQSMMLGGVDAEGREISSPLTAMCLETSYALKLIDPKINLRVSSRTPHEQYIEATRLTKAGLGFPQYSNDDIVIPALVKMGYALPDARNYTVAACWEFILPGVGMEIPNIGALSYPKMVEKATYRALASAGDFEEFMSSLKEEMHWELKAITEGVKNLYIIPAPFYSILMDGRVAAARDITLGCRYNNYGIHGTGLSTAADSLEVIRRYVFEEKSLTPQRLISAMKSDFAGEETLLHLFRFETPKLGDGDPEVTAIAARLMEYFSSGLEGIRNERGGIFRPGTGSAMFYLRHAEELDASPDGRRKGEAFGTNFSPSLYAHNKGPFSVISTFTSLPASLTPNGGPLTMEFHSSVFDTDEGITQVASLVEMFVKKGGHQLQLNSINRERLLDAQEHPEKYKNLIVRIWGWSAYFVELDKVYQDHLIARQEFDE